MEVPFKTTESGGIITASNNMNSKINKRFAQLPENLRLNGVTPSGKPRLFVCNICTRAFARQEHLIRHKRSHTNEKPYVCVICDRRFSRRDLLLRHAHKLHGGDCAESLVRKCSPTRRRLSSVVRRRKGGDTASSDGGKSGSGSDTTTVMDETVAIEANAGRARRRRISFSAQSGESYASAACHETGVTNDADKVQFSTPQLLPIDLTQDSSSITPLEANQWVNDINNLPSLDSVAMARCSTSKGSIGDGIMENNLNKPPSSMFMWQKSKVKSLFSNTLQSPPTAARISSISSVLDHSRRASTRNTSSPRSCEGSEGSETNEFRFLPGECNRGSNSRSPADQGFNTNDIVSTFDKFMRTGYSFYGLENPDLTSTIMRSNVPQMDNVCKTVQYTDIINCNFFTQELRSMCSTALEYYSLHCIKCSTTTASSVTLPSCRELNLYLSMFINHFASHIPFIHPQLWQSDLQSFRGYIYGGMENAAVSNDYALQCAHIVCLPLLAATMGSMYTKSYGQDIYDSVSSRTSHMYEISRRVLHVFLETRNVANLSLSSLWLVQSLMLSILYSLIVKPWEGTSKKSSDTVVKQLSAVCTMVRRDLLPAIGFSDKATNLNSPAEYIFLESKIRATLLCYNICQSLRCFYNITSPNFLKEADLDSIMISDEEAAWNAATLDFNTSLELGLATQKALKGKKNTMLFGKFYQTFTFSTLGAHAIPEYLATTMLYYEFSNMNSAFHIFLTKIDTKKLEVNLPLLSGTSQGGANATPTSVSSENSLHTTNLLFPIDPIKSLSQDAVILKNGLMCMVFFRSIDPNYGWQIGNQCVENMFDFYLDPGKFNILVNGSYKLITDFLVSLNFSIQNISSIIQSFEAPILDTSRTSISNLQCYYFNFLVVIKFIMDFERTPNFKLLCIYTELKKLANKLFIPALSNCYPLEFAKFLDSDSELLGLWKDPSSSANMYSDYGDDSNFANGTNIQNDLQNNVSKPQPAQRFEQFNAGQLEKLINNVLVYSFNDSNFLSMPENASNEFVFNSHPKVSSLISPPSLSPKPTVSSLNLLRFHHELNRSGKKVHQTFADHYHLAEKYILIAKCIYLHAYESYIYSNFLKGLSDNFQTLERLLLRQEVPEPKVNGDTPSKLGIGNNGSVHTGDLFSNRMTD